MISCENNKSCLEKYVCSDLNKLIKDIPSEDILYENSEVIKALSEPIRLKILYLLKKGELCACHIDSALDKPQSTISHHLNVLKKVKFLKWRKEGKWTYYSLSDEKIIDYVEKLIKIGG
jgi:ArsR family transcriptional regulator